ncbi:acetylcholine receptor subunit delta [Pseudonaja textilis]|uniref:acetylcholine receptor subunit delta n=1 Tax=Pseudonaja textilis TaxID=8673 RepID=UPI000EAA752F|nr:acetylcholine receptor subunit delta [Pseudonaja textilis]
MDNWTLQLVLFCTLSLPGVLGVNMEEQVVKLLFTERQYDRKLRPVVSRNDTVKIELGLTLSNLLSLKEADETLTTNVWLEQIWTDYRLQWNKEEYGGVSLLRLRPEMVWLPDIVLENNNDGNFEIAYSANVLVDSEGSVYWLPPSIFRTACPINVNYFPFDWQNCTLRFCSLRYNANEINLQLKSVNNSNRVHLVEWINIERESFKENGEWAIIHRPARKNINSLVPRDSNKHQDVTFYLIIKRKPLFYIINIVTPCILIAFMIVLVFYLPADSGGEKMTLAISILLAQSVFLLLISQRLPATSFAIPLIGKYLTFLLGVTIAIVVNAVIVLNVSLRTPNTHSMSERIRQLFLHLVPHYLGMHMRRISLPAGNRLARRRSSLGLMAKAEEYMLWKARSELLFERQKERDGLMKILLAKIGEGLENGGPQEFCNSLRHAALEIQSCVNACNHITKTLQEKNNFDSENEEWILVGRVIDRVCFLLMASVFIFGTVGVFLMAQFNQAPAVPFVGDPRRFLPSE